MSADVAYHLLELQIASNPADTRRVMPAIGRDMRRVLDVGCGAGQTLIASALRPDVTAIGIDCEPDALKMGRVIDPRIPFICARGESLPLATDHFDLVISRVALPYMQTRAALSEMTRVLSPGGTLWLALHSFPQLVAELRHHVHARHWRAAAHRLYAMANGALTHFAGVEFRAPLHRRYATFHTEDRIRRELECLGYQDIEVTRRGFFVVTARKPSR